MAQETIVEQQERLATEYLRRYCPLLYEHLKYVDLSVRGIRQETESLARCLNYPRPIDNTDYIFETWDKMERWLDEKSGTCRRNHEG